MVPVPPNISWYNSGVGTADHGKLISTRIAHDVQTKFHENHLVPTLMISVVQSRDGRQTCLHTHVLKHSLLEQLQRSNEINTAEYTDTQY